MSKKSGALRAKMQRIRDRIRRGEGSSHDFDTLVEYELESWKTSRAAGHKYGFSAELLPHLGNVKTARAQKLWDEFQAAGETPMARDFDTRPDAKPAESDVKQTELPLGEESVKQDAPRPAVQAEATPPSEGPPPLPLTGAIMPPAMLGGLLAGLAYKANEYSREHGGFIVVPKEQEEPVFAFLKYWYTKAAEMMVPDVDEKKMAIAVVAGSAALFGGQYGYLKLMESKKPKTATNGAAKAQPARQEPAKTAGPVAGVRMDNTGKVTPITGSSVDASTIFQSRSDAEKERQ